MRRLWKAGRATAKGDKGLRGGKSNEERMRLREERVRLLKGRKRGHGLKTVE